MTNEVNNNNNNNDDDDDDDDDFLNGDDSYDEDEILIVEKNVSTIRIAYETLKISLSVLTTAADKWIGIPIRLCNIIHSISKHTLDLP